MTSLFYESSQFTAYFMQNSSWVGLSFMHDYHSPGESETVIVVGENGKSLRKLNQLSAVKPAMSQICFTMDL